MGSEPDFNSGPQIAQPKPRASQPPAKTRVPGAEPSACVRQPGSRAHCPFAHVLSRQEDGRAPLPAHRDASSGRAGCSSAVLTRPPHPPLPLATLPSFPCDSDSVLERCAQADVQGLTQQLGPPGITQSSWFRYPLSSLRHTAHVQGAQSHNPSSCGLPALCAPGVQLVPGGMPVPAGLLQRLAGTQVQRGLPTTPCFS